MTLIEQVKELHAEGLYSNLKILASMLLTMTDHSTDMFSPMCKYQLQAYFADSLYETLEYKRAEAMYRKALQQRKAASKNNRAKTSSSTPPQQWQPSEVELKYKIYQCHMHLKESRDAMSILESVPAKQRTAKVNMALGKLYQKAGMERSAISCFKEVLRQCPLSLEAILCLLALGVKVAEVAGMTMAGVQGLQNSEWLSSWIKGHAYLSTKDYSRAINTFNTLDKKTLLRDNLEVLGALGDSFYKANDYKNAIAKFERIHMLDPYLLKGMDLYASLLAKENKADELQQLGTALFQVSDRQPEPWITLGYHCACVKRHTRAIYFAAKAYQLNQESVQALLLKGSTLQQIEKTQEAILHYREVMRMVPDRLESYEGLVECYLSNGRNREAVSVALNACKTLGYTPSTLTLYASVLMEDPPSQDKAKSTLDRALSIKPDYLKAVTMKVKILQIKQKYEEAIELLRSQLVNQSLCVLHQLLGDCLSAVSDYQEALDQYSIALSIDPTDQKSLEGLQRIEKNGNNLEASQDEDVDAMEDEEEAELLGSDAEAQWSDQEQWYGVQ
ncbi:PREDICTED: anaphase-promoting complex subunit 7-like [Branchiostoma belcheri]|uniref:Anaphase-promoting complex subunit 7-like n=1 Tax=Branchiostoma belcheri TaxID=7741 RepID=A0A6P4Z9R5_BRABE|nr:PREDICTED: anaphase-promoting complex subunit 7-like [Branchiostoma belcheri]